MGAAGFTRDDYGWNYDTAPDVNGPAGMNSGYIHGTAAPENQWVRGSSGVPELGYGYDFAMARPRYMREPRTNLGTYPIAKG